MKDKLQQAFDILAEVEQNIAIKDRDECYDHILTILETATRIGDQIKVSNDHIQHSVAYRGHSTTGAQPEDYVP